MVYSEGVGVSWCGVYNCYLWARCHQVQVCICCRDTKGGRHTILAEAIICIQYLAKIDTVILTDDLTEYSPMTRGRPTMLARAMTRPNTHQWLDRIITDESSPDRLRWCHEIKQCFFCAGSGSWGIVTIPVDDSTRESITFDKHWVARMSCCWKMRPVQPSPYSSAMSSLVQLYATWWFMSRCRLRFLREHCFSWHIQSCFGGKRKQRHVHT